MVCSLLQNIDFFMPPPPTLKGGAFRIALVHPKIFNFVIKVEKWGLSGHISICLIRYAKRSRPYIYTGGEGKQNQHTHNAKKGILSESGTHRGIIKILHHLIYKYFACSVCDQFLIVACALLCLFLWFNDMDSSDHLVTFI